MASYTIAAVSSQPPKEWSGKYGSMLTYKVRFKELGEETIDINRKPSSPAPKVGDMLSGSIENTDFGKKFKADSQVPGARSYQLKDEAAIKAMWAIGKATDVYGDKQDKIEDLANKLFGMVDRVKASPGEREKELAAVNLDAPINLDEIPFD